MLAAEAKPHSEELLGITREQRDAAVLALMRCQGLAPGEVRQLDIGDVDLAAGRLYVRGGGHGRSRCLALRADAQTALETYLSVRRAKTSIALFVTRERTRLAARTLRTIARRHGVNGLELRQSFIRMTLAQGMAPRQLCKELGVTSIYGTLASAPRRAKPKVVVMPRSPGGWPAALRQWVLETLEKQLEAWNLKGYQRIPANFPWPPLPPADLRRLRAAEGNITDTITVILEKLMA